MDRHAPARLVEEQAPERIVGAEVLHLLEDGLAGRRLDPADDDVPDLTARVTPDDRQDGPGRSPPDRREWIAGRMHDRQMMQEYRTARPISSRR